MKMNRPETDTSIFTRPVSGAAHRPARGFKAAIKALSGAVIRGASHLCPANLLFRILLPVRRLEIRLRKMGSPLALQKGMDHLYYSLRPALVRTAFRGWILHVRLNDPFHYDLILENHEPGVAEWLAQNVKPGMTIFDIGANIGSYTLFLAGLVREQGRVIAVEADPDVARILETNIQSNALRTVRPIHAAAYRECGEIQLGRAQASTGYSGLYYSKASEWIAVPAYSLDVLTEKLGLSKVDFVKVDVEGAECDVLAGMDSLLRNHHPLLLIELHPATMPQALEIPERLRTYGYSVEFLTSTHVTAR